MSHHWRSSVVRGCSVARFAAINPWHGTAAGEPAVASHSGLIRLRTSGERRLNYNPRRSSITDRRLADVNSSRGFVAR